MIKRCSLFPFLLIFTLACLPVAGQVRDIPGGDASAVSVDCSGLFQPFTIISLDGSPLNELAQDYLLASSNRLTPYDEEESAGEISRSKNREGARSAGLALTFAGLGILGVTGLVYVTEYLVDETCKYLNTCSSLNGGSGVTSPGQIGTTPYLIAVSVGGAITLIGLIITVSSVQ